MFVSERFCAYQDRSFYASVFFHAWGTGGFLVKPRQTPGGMIHFWGDFSLAFSAHHGGAVPQPGFTPAFAGILLPARAGFFILRELAEFGYGKRLRATFHFSRLVSPVWFPIRSGRSWVGEGDVGMVDPI